MFHEGLFLGVAAATLPFRHHVGTPSPGRTRPERRPTPHPGARRMRRRSLFGRIMGHDHLSSIFEPYVSILISLPILPSLIHHSSRCLGLLSGFPERGCVSILFNKRQTNNRNKVWSSSFFDLYVRNGVGVSVFVMFCLQRLSFNVQSRKGSHPKQNTHNQIATS